MRWLATVTMRQKACCLCCVACASTMRARSLTKASWSIYLQLSNRQRNGCLTMVNQTKHGCKNQVVDALLDQGFCLKAINKNNNIVEQKKWTHQDCLLSLQLWQHFSAKHRYSLIAWSPIWWSTNLKNDSNAGHSLAKSDAYVEMATEGITKFLEGAIEHHQDSMHDASSLQ